MKMDYGEIERLRDLAGMLPHIRAHCDAVANKAVELARRLNAHGYKLDIDLIDCGARLHDIMRLEANHARAGADFLRSQGHYAVAEVVERHMRLPKDESSPLDECALVFFVDKIMREDELVDVHTRYEHALNMYAADTPGGQSVRRNMNTALCIQRKIEEVLNCEFE